MKRVKVVVWGVGAMGSGAVRVMLEKDWIATVGGIVRPYPDPKDAAKRRAGKDLGEVAGLGRKLGVTVSDDPDAVLAKTKPDIIIHATNSQPQEIETQIIKAVQAGCDVISIAETRLVYPWVHYRESAQRIDEAAKKRGVTVLATGINPGFIMDLVPLTFTGICASVRKVTLTRLLDVVHFGAGVVSNLGIGLTIAEFRKGLADGSIGWILPMTCPQIDMIADTLGWKLDETKRVEEPVTSKKAKKTGQGTVIEPGKICGVKWRYYGMKGGKPVITFDWIHWLHPEDEGQEIEDRIVIEGESDVEVVVKKLDSGVGTYAHAVNYIPLVMEARPGLLTVKDLPIAVALK